VPAPWRLVTTLRVHPTFPEGARGARPSIVRCRIPCAPYLSLYCYCPMRIIILSYRRYSTIVDKQTVSRYANLKTGGVHGISQFILPACCWPPVYRCWRSAHCRTPMCAQRPNCVLARRSPNRILRADAYKAFGYRSQGTVTTSSRTGEHAVQAGHRAHCPSAGQPGNGQSRAQVDISKQGSRVSLDDDLGLPCSATQPI